MKQNLVNLIYLLMTTYFAISSEVHAVSCSPAGSALPAPIINSDYTQAQPGSRISSWSQQDNMNLVHCSDNKISPWLVLGSIYSNQPQESGMTLNEDGQSYPVFQTNTPGIGFVIGYQSRCDSGWKPLRPNKPFFSNFFAGNQQCSSVNHDNIPDIMLNNNQAALNYVGSTTIKLALIKTGPIKQTAINLNNLLNKSAYIFKKNEQGLWQSVFNSPTYPIPTQPITLTAACKTTFVNGNTLTLPKKTISDMPTVGSTTGKTSFEVEISCTCSHTVTHYYFTAPHEISGNNTLLANIATTTPAQGIAIQLTDETQGGKPIVLSTKTPVSPHISKPHSDKVKLKFAAQYYRYQQTPYAPGKVKALTVFDITYN